MKVATKKPKCLCVYRGFDTAHILDKGADLRRNRGYITGRFPLARMLMQLPEASATPLIAWNLSLSLLHDKCIRTQSVWNGFQTRRERERSQIKGAQACTRTEILCGPMGRNG